MQSLTTRERFQRMFNHQDADRVPMLGGPWGTTLARWHSEGMPTDADFADYFGLDHTVGLGGDISPRYEHRVIEETDDYVIAFDAWGTTSKNWKHQSSTPHWLGRTIKDRETWEAAKARMVMGRDRINWDHLKAGYATWRERNWWINAGLFFGFDVTHSRIVGTEDFLVMMFDEPDLVADIYNTELDCSLQLLDMMWDEGYTFDSIFWCDDMGYRNGTFFSVPMYRELLKPVQARAIRWAHEKGIVAHLHSCGNINEFVPELLDIGLDALNPLEVKAGMNPAQLKADFGDKLVLHGGINAMLWDHIDQIEAEIIRLLPILKQSGGYIFAEDHSIPDSVSLKDYRRILELARELGRY